MYTSVVSAAGGFVGHASRWYRLCTSACRAAVKCITSFANKRMHEFVT